ncbi:MAG: molybdenum cofactor guanylyltransferase [Deltaproteobacteria bacterium]|nr:molybdenum cofactor guanylyltransferase [Deltaproteobacteria bacterium]
MAPGTITGAVLGGGRSRRLGRDKASLPLNGRPLACWVATVISPLVEECWLITNQPLSHLCLGLPLLTDLVPGRGALGGLLTAMLVARGSHVLLSACDTPFLRPALLTAMLDQAGQGSLDAVVCRSSRGLEPLPGVFNCRILSRVQTQLQSGDLRLRTLLADCRTRVLPPEEVALYDAGELSFFNINTGEEAAQAAVLLASGSKLARNELCQQA